MLASWRHVDGIGSFGRDGGGVLIHGDVGVLIDGRRSELVASGQTVRAPRLKCSALIFENKHSHSPALEHAAGTSTQIIWDI